MSKTFSDDTICSEAQSIHMIQKASQGESRVSRDIKILSEVEKTFIIFDGNNDGILEYHEVVDYFRSSAYPDLNLDDR